MHKMTQEQIKRINQAIAETGALLQKELGYSKDLQNAEAVEFYRSHINKLKGMLSA